MRFLVALELQAVVLLSTIHLVLSSAHHDLSARAPSGSKTVIIQMFEWNWDSVAAECTDFIGPAGYGFVQGSCQVIITHVDRKLTRLLLVSPAQEHIVGPQWWTDYQPVSYNLTSKRGNRTQYQKLVSGLFLLGPIDFS
jgi:hypothetical protein